MCRELEKLPADTLITTRLTVDAAAARRFGCDEPILHIALTRGEDGNWSIYCFTGTELRDQPDPGTPVPAETVDAEPQFPPETSMEAS